METPVTKGAVLVAAVVAIAENIIGEAPGSVVSVVSVVGVAASRAAGASSVTDCSDSLRAHPNNANKTGDSPGTPGEVPAKALKPTIASIRDITVATTFTGVGAGCSAGGVDNPCDTTGDINRDCDSTPVPVGATAVVGSPVTAVLTMPCALISALLSDSGF
jgi:hypothetical protein